MEQETIALTQVTQTQKDKCHVFPLISGVSFDCLDMCAHLEHHSGQEVSKGS